MKDLDLNLDLIGQLNQIDDDLIHQAVNVEQHIRARRRKRIAFLSAASAAACFAFLFGFMLFGENELINEGVVAPSTGTENPENTSHTQSSSEFTGLPVERFCLGDIEKVQTSSRTWMATDILDFFKNPQFAPRAFAYVKVVETQLHSRSEEREAKVFSESAQEGEETEYNTYTYTWETQTVKLQVLSTVWNNGDRLPQNIELEQYLYNIPTINNNATNALRKDGVYLLPLWNHNDSHKSNKANDPDIEWEYEWFNMSDSEVLFEVDDKGLIFSHSPYEGLNKYDGKPSSVLASAIANITKDDDYDIAITNLGQQIRWLILARVMVESIETGTTDWGDPLYTYNLRANELIAASKFMSVTVPPMPSLIPAWEYQKGDLIPTLSQGTVFLDKGKEYLMLIDPGYDQHYFNKPYINAPAFAAEVNKDGTITELNDSEWSAFEGFDGNSVEQILDSAKRALAFLERY